MHTFFLPLILIQTSYKLESLKQQERSCWKKTPEVDKFPGTGWYLEVERFSGRSIHLIIGMGERITAKKSQS